MYVENPRNEALKALINGREVIVIHKFDDKSFTVDNLKDMLPEEGFHYLVDVPAFVNQDFEQAVYEMVESDRKIRDENLAVAEPEHPAKAGSNPSPSPFEKSKPAVKHRANLDPVEVKKHAVKKSNKELAEHFGVSPAAMSSFCKRHGIKPMDGRKQTRPAEKIIEDNTDRHLCKTCAYRPGKTDSAKYNCDYVAKTGRLRGCKVEECDKYIKGEPIKAKELEDMLKE